MFEQLLNVWYSINGIPITQKSPIIDSLLTIQIIISFGMIVFFIYLSLKEGDDIMLMLITGAIVIPTAIIIELLAHRQRTD